MKRDRANTPKEMIRKNILTWASFPYEKFVYVYNNRGWLVHSSPIPGRWDLNDLLFWDVLDIDEIKPALSTPGMGSKQLTRKGCPLWEGYRDGLLIYSFCIKER